MRNIFWNAFRRHVRERRRTGKSSKGGCLTIPEIHCRLKNVMHERECTPGIRLLMALLSVCIMCHGTLAFSVSRSTLDTLVAYGRAMNHVLYEVYYVRDKID